ncbi:MAG: hypothetical protein Q8N88_05680 [Nanoarchaeota archaeon]|nr:hypothetical protein [Nanoarchaeota archaeon]
MIEVKKRDGTITEFDMKKIADLIINTIDETMQRERNHQVMLEAESFLCTYNELTNEVQQILIAQASTDTLSQTYSALVLLIEKLKQRHAGDDWLNSSYSEFAIKLKKQIKKELRKRWRKNSTLKVRVVQFQQYAATMIKNGSKLLGSPILKNILSLINIVLKIALLLPKKQQKKLFKALV